MNSNLLAAQVQSMAAKESNRVFGIAMSVISVGLLGMMALREFRHCWREEMRCSERGHGR